MPLGEFLGTGDPLYFAPAGFEEKPTLKRSNAFDIVAKECRMVRDVRGPPRYRLRSRATK